MDQGRGFMCDLSIILLRGDVREEIMNAVVKIEVNGKSIRLTGLFGETQNIEGTIKEINIIRREAIIVSK
jgi:predicted RNA-binding protein